MTKAEGIKNLQTELKRYQKKVGDQHKEIAALNEEILGWKEREAINNALVAVLLKMLGAEEKSVEVKREDITKALRELMVEVSLTESMDYKLRCAPAPQSEETE